MQISNKLNAYPCFPKKNKQNNNKTKLKTKKLPLTLCNDTRSLFLIDIFNMHCHLNPIVNASLNFLGLRYEAQSKPFNCNFHVIIV